jgi:hypothetical protein
MIKSKGQIAYDKHQATLTKKPIGQLAYNKHWSVEGLVKSMGYTQEEINSWAKLNKHLMK